MERMLFQRVVTGGVKGGHGLHAREVVSLQAPEAEGELKRLELEKTRGW